MRFIFLAALMIATFNANAYFSNDTMTCTGENPKDLIGTLTLDLDRQIFISSKDTNGFGDEILGLQQLETRTGNLVYRAKDEAGEFILTFYIPEKLIPLDYINRKPFIIKLKLWSRGDGDSGSVMYSLKCAAIPD